jgi:hypothetical protein
MPDMPNFLDITENAEYADRQKRTAAIVSPKLYKLRGTLATARVSACC